MANKVTFRKNGSAYYPMRNGKPLKVNGSIHIYYSWYSHSNYYKINDKVFGTLKEAKEYFVANMEVQA